MPTSITSNGDRLNDEVKVNGWGIKEMEEFMIFNRWGQMVFSTNKLEEGWDGKLNGVSQTPDVYVYKVRAKTFKDQILFSEGYINLIQ